MSFSVPLYSKDPNEGSIEYMATKETLDSTEGFFSFTYYIPSNAKELILPDLVYIKGIHSYSKLIDGVNTGAVGAGEGAQGGVFKNWKVLVYTDEYTYNRIQNIKNETVDEAGWLSDVNDIKNEKYKMHVYQTRLKIIEEEKGILKELQEISEYLLQKAVLALVKWPSHEHTNDRHDIHGPTLRPFRSRAPFDFPNKPIFIRDADTLFPSALK